MITIKISKDFTDTPGARVYNDGEFSGEEFYDKLLKPKFEEAKRHGTKLMVDLDGTNGYASSFLNEAFGRLGNEYGPDLVWESLEITSLEVPKYIQKVKEAVYEKRK